MAKKIDLKMPRWLMGQDPNSRRENLHYLTHLQPPRFSARWCFGPPSPKPKNPEQVFVETGEGDLVHIYDFLWTDPTPDPDAFDSLMNEAIDAVDQWLENNIAPPTR
ncbi:MAG: hypothetical protein HQL47_04665 [Gammaproteobacteria bacterium]|nr:hypothetical protein [Gammaproteobacteria bacterium]